MQRSNLPKKLGAVFYLFLLGSLLISGCTSRNSAKPFPHEEPDLPGSFVININTADAVELQKLPRVGPRLAAKIVEHRDRYGPFRKVEHLLIVDGVSEERFRELRKFINTE